MNPAHYWARYPDKIAAFCERLAGVVIENRPAIDVMRDRDGARVLHYVDPPYVTGTRVMNAGDRYYRHEMSDAEHVNLLNTCRQMRGFVVISGYSSPLYRDLLSDWAMHETQTTASGNRGSVARSECIWLNSAAQAALRQQDLFNKTGIA